MCGPEKGAEQDVEITFFNCESAGDRQKIEADSSESCAKPARQPDFMSEEKAQKRNEDDIKPGDEPRLSGSRINNADLLQRRPQKEHRSGEEAAIQHHAGARRLPSFTSNGKRKQRQSAEGETDGVATVFDEFPVSTVRLFYRTSGASVYDSTDMVPTGNPDEYAKTLSLTEAGSYEYYIKAVDAKSQARTTAVYDFQLYPACGELIYYDDGSADRFNWAGAEEFRWAVKFTPVSTPFVLCGARVSVSSDKPDAAHTRIYVEVYDENGGKPGTLLFKDTTGSIGNIIGGLPPGQTHWADVVLRDTSGEPLELWGDFFIAVGNPDTLVYEAFSRDTTSANRDRSFLYDGCTEMWYNENDFCENCKVGNRMIRAIGYYPTPLEVSLSRSGDDAELCWSSTGAPYYRVYSDSSPFGNYTTLEGATSDTFFFDVGAINEGIIKFYRVYSSTLP